MVRKLFFIFALFLFLPSSLLAVNSPQKLPENFFQDLREKFKRENADRLTGANQQATRGPLTPVQAPTNPAQNLRQETPQASDQNQYQPPKYSAQKSPEKATTAPRTDPRARSQPQMMPPRVNMQPNHPSPVHHRMPNHALKKVNPCDEIPAYLDEILTEIAKKDSDIIMRLPPCFALDRRLILKAVVTDPLQFQYAHDSLQEDRTFVNRLLKISPKILQFATPEIRGDKSFMEKATYISRDALQYASWNLIDNKLFMRKMIDIDSRNYKFASRRLKRLPEFAKIAFKDNGLLLEFAPRKIKNNKSLVKIAILSNSSAIEFASSNLQKNKILKILARKKTSIKSEAELEKFLRKNYIVKSTQKNLNDIIGNQAKFYKEQQLISRNYITKWHDYINYSFREGRSFARNSHLIAAASRNYHISWHDDFKEYKTASAKVKEFLKNHLLPSNVIDNLSTTYLWKIKDKPLTLALNLYLLRDSTDEDLGPNFVDVTSLTAILQKRGKRWKMTIIDVILDSEIKVDITYPSGHKKHILWDLYTTDEDDDNPKIIFKVEGGLREYFEVFEEQAGGKYQMVYRSKDLQPPSSINAE
jgi:hypothetical protein